MFCREHKHESLTEALGACRECGHQTNSELQLCKRCSKCFDECAFCRTPLRSGRSTRLIAAFKCEEAKAARKGRLAAIAETERALSVLAQEFADTTAPATAAREKLMEPVREEFLRATQEYERRLLEALAAERAVRDNPNATTGQKVDAKEELRKIEVEISERTKPARVLFQNKSLEIQARYDEETKPLREEHLRKCKKVEHQCSQELARHEQVIKELLRRAENPCRMVIDFIKSLNPSSR